MHWHHIILRAHCHGYRVDAVEHATIILLQQFCVLFILLLFRMVTIYLLRAELVGDSLPFGANSNNYHATVLLYQHGELRGPVVLRAEPCEHQALYVDSLILVQTYRSTATLLQQYPLLYEYMRATLLFCGPLTEGRKRRLFTIYCTYCAVLYHNINSQLTFSSSSPSSLSSALLFLLSGLSVSSCPL